VVFGDGVHTILQLLEAVNADPRRAEGHAAPLTKVVLDSIALQVLAEQELLPESVPAAGARVLIRRNGNLSTGGTATDVTAEVHPEVAARAVEAARMVGLDVAGIDVLAQDIGRPLEEQGGAVIEVNAGPGLRMHLHPSHGQPRPVGESIVRLMFASDDTGRIPIVAVAGECGNTITSRLVAHLVEQTGTSVGLAAADGLSINRRSIESDASHGFASARALLLNPLVETAIVETGPAMVLNEGLPFDRCDVAIVMWLATAEEPAEGSEPDGPALALSCLMESIAPSGTAVLHADDPQLAAFAASCPRQIIYFSHDDTHPLLSAHRLDGGRAVFVRDHCIIAAAGRREILVAPLDGLAFTYGGLIGLHVDSALAAVAGCWALGVSWQRLRAGLESFAADLGPLIDLAVTRQ
jgi:cyanophycin synthetase